MLVALLPEVLAENTVYLVDKKTKFPGKISSTPSISPDSSSLSYAGRTFMRDKPNVYVYAGKQNPSTSFFKTSIEKDYAGTDRYQLCDSEEETLVLLKDAEKPAGFAGPLYTKRIEKVKKALTVQNGTVCSMPVIFTSMEFWHSVNLPTKQPICREQVQKFFIDMDASQSLIDMELEANGVIDEGLKTAFKKAISATAGSSWDEAWVAVSSKPSVIGTFYFPCGAIRMSLSALEIKPIKKIPDLELVYLSFREGKSTNYFKNSKILWSDSFKPKGKKIKNNEKSKTKKDSNPQNPKKDSAEKESKN